MNCINLNGFHRGCWQVYTPRNKMMWTLQDHDLITSSLHTASRLNPFAVLELVTYHVCDALMYGA